MASNPRLEHLIQEAETLSSAEKLELARVLIQHAKRPASSSSESWLDLFGIAADVRLGDDPQSWVNRMRDEDDKSRTQS